MFGEVNELESFLFSVKATDLDWEDEIFKEFKEVFDLLVVIVFWIFGKVDEILPKCCCFISLSPFL